MLLSWRFGLGVVLAFIVGAILMGCAASKPRPIDWPARSCGSAAQVWTLAELLPARTVVLARAAWSQFTLGDVTVTRQVDDAAFQIPVRVKPWAGGKGLDLHWADKQYELFLQSADASGCYYLSLTPGLALFRYRGQAELVYLRVFGGWVALAPRGGSTLR